MVNEDQAKTLVREMSQVFDFLKSEMFRAQKIQEEMVNLSRTPASCYVVGDSVWLSIRNIEAKRSSKKIDFKQICPYLVKQIMSPYAYKLELSTSMKIHPAFHISFISPAVNDPILGQIVELPQRVEVKGETEWEVGEILDSKKRVRQVEYLVKYVGYEEPSRQSSNDLEHSPELRKLFHRQYFSEPHPIMS